jgi:hypothetical protein
MDGLIISLLQAKDGRLGGSSGKIDQEILEYRCGRGYLLEIKRGEFVTLLP